MVRTGDSGNILQFLRPRDLVQKVLRMNDMRFNLLSFQGREAAFGNTQ